MKYHLDRCKITTKKERGHSPDKGDLERSVIKMRHATSAREASNGAMEFKSQGWFGVLILKYCGGRTPQEFATQARIIMERINMTKARMADRLHNLQKSAAAAASREKRESDLAAQRAREEAERAEARSGIAAAFAAELTRRANREVNRTLDEEQRAKEARREAASAAAAESLRRQRTEYMRSSSSKEGKNPYSLPLRPKSEPPHKQPPQPRGSAGGVFPTQYPTPPPKRSPASRKESRTNLIGEHGSRWRGQPPPPKRPSANVPEDPDASEVPQAMQTPRQSKSAQEEHRPVAPASDPQDRRNQKAETTSNTPPQTWSVDLEPSPTATPSGAPEAQGPLAKAESVDASVPKATPKASDTFRPDSKQHYDRFMKQAANDPANMLS